MQEGEVAIDVCQAKRRGWGKKKKRDLREAAKEKTQSINQSIPCLSIEFVFKSQRNPNRLCDWSANQANPLSPNWTENFKK